jgi:hypothetical protein
VRIFENVTADFTWKLESNRFIQSGTVTRPDGKKIILDRFIFERAGDKGKTPASPFVATWELQDTGNRKGLLIITPTHWMGILQSNGKFEKAFGGTYMAQGISGDFTTDFSSEQHMKAKLSAKVQAGKLYFENLTFIKITR